MERTAIVGFAGGYCNARINYNYQTGKWDVNFHNMQLDTGEYELDRHRGASFDTPREAMMFVADNLGWEEGANVERTVSTANS